MRHRHGAAPLLWVFAVLAILFLLVERVIHSLEVEETIAESSRLDRLAENGFRDVTQWAIWHLERDARLSFEDGGRPPTHDSLLDVWNLGPTRPYWHEDLPELLIRWHLIDAHSRLNINSLVDANGLVSETNRQRLTNVLLDLRFPEVEALVASLCDWIDREPSDDLSQEVSVDENAFEEGARNAPLSLLSELAMVPGYTKEILWGDEEDQLGLAPWLTIQSDGKINPNTAPAWVILGAHENITPSTARGLVDGRKSRPYQTLDEVIEVAGSAQSIDFQSIFTVISSHFVLEMEADYNGRSQKQRVFLERNPENGVVRVKQIERKGFFQWPDEIREAMKEAEEDLMEEIRSKSQL